MNEALERAARAARLLVACDFDGTLSPIVDRPDDARPAPGAIKALTALERLPGTSVAVISGRQLDTLRALSGAPDTIRLVGSHGAELGEVRLEHGQALELDELERTLRQIADDHPGAHIERKTASVAFHLRRLVEPSADLLSTLERLAHRWGGRVIRGKEVLEWSVHDASKGDAIDHLRSELRADVVVYAGDDVTDEDAFAVLTADDVGIKVGGGDTAAAHRVDSPTDVVELLERLIDLRSDAGRHPDRGDQPISR